jgi:predicted type IV restriction endonuclease
LPLELTNGTQYKEIALSYNWNVYKLFKSGNRAKAPITTFESTEELAQQHFDEVIKAGFNKKLSRSDFQIVRADLPQHENLVSEEEKFSKEKNRVLARIVKQKNLDHKYRLSTSLVYCRDSEWNWQWAAIETGTSKFVSGLSEMFDTYSGAQTWMQEQISQLT